MSKYGIADMLKSSLTDEPATMKTAFGELMKDKVRDALETKRDEVTANIYNDPEDEDEQDDDTEVDNDTDDDTDFDEPEDDDTDPRLRSTGSGKTHHRQSPRPHVLQDVSAACR